VSRPETAAAAAPSRQAWLRWTGAFLAAALTIAGLVCAFVVALDPFGLRVTAGKPARPLMDINQRFMYPQLVRSGAFDSAVIGTSTMRLLDPAILSGAIGGRFANLAMNAATPWEQLQMAQLFTRLTPSARAIIWGVDLTWCAPDATAQKNRLTPRPFPPWLYDAPGLLDPLRQLNLTTLEISARLLGHRLGLQPERIRGDGYEVFTPPEHLYELARARLHLGTANAGVTPAGESADPVSAQERASWRFPALAWIEEALAGAPAAALKLLVLPPTHVSALPRAGSAGAQVHAACKDALRALAGRQGAIVLDYAYPSAVTRIDENYWDPLHFRLPIARLVETDLAAVAKGGEPVAAGISTLSRPSR
jgi:hypothetical protein